MKFRDLIAKLEAAGAVLVRHGADHDWYRNPRTGVAQPVPRHCEVNEHTARSIIRRLSDEPR
ncbi:MAG: type II toxin-antitoxin system HicA family toxin [Kiritimatiellae bacterium]|nr:type II toxin-antitoxin system HicA family toxin [Kiritimatiellia bacterium]